MHPILVADIGGTHARFGLSWGKDAETKIYNISEQKVYRCAEYRSLTDVIREYLSEVNEPNIQYACIAVAGPVDGDRIKLTNLSWDFSKTTLKQTFGFERLEVVNDFAALAYSAKHLKNQDLMLIKEGRANPEGVKAIVGPGTGLGVAALVPMGERWIPLPGEGGHSAFAPINEKEAAILALARRRQPHVSTETFLSGNGLRYLYQIIATLHGEHVADYQAKDISFHAINGSDDVCYEALSLFCGMLGNFCGDVALMYGSTGGLYLGGGILPRFKTFLMDSDFSSRFSHKGVMSDFVQEMPVYLMTHPQPALVGAAGWINSLIQQKISV